MQRLYQATRLSATLTTSLKRNMSTSQQQQTTDAAMREGYKQWRVMGMAGTFYTWAGYMSSVNTGKTIAFGPDQTTDLTFYRKTEKYATGWKRARQTQRESALRSFLIEPLPERQGPRARVKPFVFPQRERNAAEYQDPKVKKAYLQASARFGDTNKQNVEWKTSALEKHGQALFTRPHMSDTPLAGPAPREICHLHETDLSGHVTLSFADAEEVISKG